MENRIELNRRTKIRRATRYFSVAEEHAKSLFKVGRHYRRIIYRAFRRHRFDSPRARLSINPDPHLEEGDISPLLGNSASLSLVDDVDNAKFYGRPA